MYIIFYITLLYNLLGDCMDKVKKYGKTLLYWTIFFIIYLILLVILNYTQILKFNTITKINIVVIAIMTFLFGIHSGKQSEKKGYKEGLKQGLLIIGILLILNIIFIRKFSLSIFTYYLIILLSSIFGSMIGINLKKK